jgi:hypothetical protein
MLIIKVALACVTHRRKHKYLKCKISQKDKLKKNTEKFRRITNGNGRDYDLWHKLASLY